MLENGARDRDALLFAARQLEAPLADLRLIAERKSRDEIVNLRELRGGDDFILCRAGTAIRNVVFDRVVEEHRVLRHDPDRGAQAALLDIAQVLPID